MERNDIHKPSAIIPSDPADHYRNPVDRRKASVYKLASDYKARGLSRTRAWSKFVKDRDLRPEMDAREFYQQYDVAEPRLLSSGEISRSTVKSEYTDPEFADYGRDVEVTVKVGGREEIRRGKVYRMLRSHGGGTVYEVDFGDGPQRLSTGSILKFLNPFDSGRPAE